MREYVVQPGDSPASIASRPDMAGCPKCVIDLVRANPQKQTVVAPNGFVTFRDIKVGERLVIPEKWSSPAFDKLPPRYFAALPHFDGRTPSRLGVSAAAGVLGDYAALDQATKETADLARLDDRAFPDAALTAAAALSVAVQEALMSSNTIAQAKGAEAYAAAVWAKGQALAMAAANEVGSPSSGMRDGISSVLSTGVDTARDAINALHAEPVVTPVELPPIPVTTAIPPALQGILQLDPCSPLSALAICGIQAALGISPDGKYGNDTAAKARAVVPGAPAACNPRPTWWTPTGASNCGGGLPGTTTPLPASPPLVTGPIATSHSAKGMSTASVFGVGLLGASAVGAAIYLSLNSKPVNRSRRRRS